MDVNSRTLCAAEAYAKIGWPVLPCHSVSDEGQCSCGNGECASPGKHPRTEHGFRDATTDQRTIQRWWTNWPDANIAVPTGSVSGFDVLDVDLRHGGEETLDDLQAEHGKLANTPMALTGGGGWHYLFRHREGVTNSRGKLGPGIDVQGEGGYVIVCPSTHASGKSYEWEASSRPSQVDLAPWPDGLLAMLQATNGKDQGSAITIEKNIPEGQRNDTLTSLAGTMRRPGMGEKAITAALLAENKRCTPPLAEEEVRSIASSVMRYPPKEKLTKLTEPPFVSFVSDLGGGISVADWPEPQPLPDPLPPVEPFEPRLLPEAFRPWVEDTATRMQCPIDFPAVGAMVALAAVVGRQLAIRPKERDSWTVVPNLWGGVVSRSGLLKSPALADPLRSLTILEKRAREDHEEAMGGYGAQKLVAEAKKKNAQDDMRAAMKDGQDPTAYALAVIRAVEEEPARRRYVVNDSTVEKLGEILKGNPRGVLIFRDELTGFLKTLDKDGHEGDRAFYLEAWNGTGRFTYDRIGRGTVEIEAACVSILGGIQPGPLSAYMARVAKGGGDDDGLVQRFQLVVWPDTGKKWKNVDTPPDSAARKRAHEVFERLDRIDPAAAEADLSEVEEAPPFLRFSPEAQKLFNEWRGELEDRLRSGEEHPLMESHLAKYRSLVPSLALLIHLADVWKGLVGEDALRRACAWGEYLESHARRVYTPALSPAAGAAHALADHIRRGDLEKEFTLREVQRRQWRGLTERVEVVGGLELLEALDWVRVAEEPTGPTGGRPTQRYIVNPHLLKGVERNG
jgi:hypothetical protein